MLGAPLLARAPEASHLGQQGTVQVQLALLRAGVAVGLGWVGWGGWELGVKSYYDVFLGLRDIRRSIL